MKIIITGQTVDYGVDSEYYPDKEMELEIDNEGRMIMTIDGKMIFRADCLEIKNAIDAFNI